MIRNIYDDAYVMGYHNGYHNVGYNNPYHAVKRPQFNIKYTNGYGDGMTYSLEEEVADQVMEIQQQYQGRSVGDET